MARSAAIDGGEWTGAGLAPVAGGARLQAAARPERNPSSAPARGGSAFAALVSLVVHAAIVAAAALSLSAPQPTGEPNAIAVELVASTGEAPAPTTDADLAQATRAARDDANPADATPSPPPPDVATPAKTPDADASAAPKSADATQSPPPDAATEAKAPDADASAAPKAADAANETAPAPPTAPARDPATDEVPAAAAAPPPQAAIRPPEADFAAQPAAPRVEAKPPASPPTTARATARLKPSSPTTGAHAASPPAPARGAADIAAYRNALLAKIWGAARYPEAARERGATGVATVRFALDGDGAVTLADLAQSSGDRVLDDAALAAVRRASPLPAPPTGAPRAYSAPIRFELR